MSFHSYMVVFCAPIANRKEKGKPQPKPSPSKPNPTQQTGPTRSLLLPLPTAQFASLPASPPPFRSAPLQPALPSPAPETQQPGPLPQPTHAHLLSITWASRISRAIPALSR